jgi:DNA polymerase-3 subunit epsilon
MTFEEMAATLEASGDYKILRRLVPRAHLHTPSGLTRTALFVDVETTGLDAARHEIIELAMVPFTYEREGRICEVKEPFHALQQPSDPITPEITKITGITDEMVAGKVIDWDKVRAQVEAADLIIAHNASFDRQFLERACEAFQHKPWGCSNSQVDWAAEGFEGTRLGYLVASAGFFFEKHRALNDCHAAVELLAHVLPVSGLPAFQQLLERARKVSFRVFAAYAPFEFKDVLRERGYRWNADGQGPHRAWYIDVDEVQLKSEQQFLESEVYARGVDLPVLRIDAFNRFSARI